MGFLSGILGGAATAPITAVGKIITGIFGDKGEKLSHDEVMARIALEPTMVQTEINKVEASHRSLFVAGWRPSIGWVCSISLFFFYVPQYVIASGIWIKLIMENDWQIVPYPVDDSGVMELVLAMLGMATLRGVEKLKGRAK